MPDAGVRQCPQGRDGVLAGLLLSLACQFCSDPTLLVLREKGRLCRAGRQEEISDERRTRWLETPRESGATANC